MKKTGLPSVVWILPRGNARHDVRVGVALVSKTGKFRLVSVAIRPDIHVVPDTMGGSELACLRRWVDLNREVIVKYWEGEIWHFEDAAASIKPVRCKDVVNAQDLQIAINQALGLPAGTAIGNVDLNRDGAINVVDLQITIDAALGETGFTYWSQNGIAATSVQKLHGETKLLKLAVNLRCSPIRLVDLHHLMEKLGAAARVSYNSKETGERLRLWKMNLLNRASAAACQELANALTGGPQTIQRRDKLSLVSCRWLSLLSKVRHRIDPGGLQWMPSM